MRQKWHDTHTKEGWRGIKIGQKKGVMQKQRLQNEIGEKGVRGKDKETMKNWIK